MVSPEVRTVALYLCQVLAKISIAGCLVAAAVLFHAIRAIGLNPVLLLTAQLETRFWLMTWLVVRIS